MANKNVPEQQTLFSESFMEDHAGTIVSKPYVALTELIANAYDAGATEVKIQWPEEQDLPFNIVDNGIGLSASEFSNIWCQLSVKRRKLFGTNARIPKDHRDLIKQRKAFGKNGKGRHAPLCFNASYNVETIGEGNVDVVSKKVSKSRDNTQLFHIEELATTLPLPYSHGTRISGLVSRNYISVDDVREIIESKFLVDPSFRVYLNDNEVNLSVFDNKEEIKITVEDQEIVIDVIVSDEIERKSRFMGVAWWVNARLVGEPGWKIINSDDSYIDSRYTIAKRVAFIVKADCLEDSVAADWMSFIPGSFSEKVIAAVNKAVKDKLISFFRENSQKTKEDIIKKHVDEWQEYSTVTRFTLGVFVDEVLKKDLTISPKDLDNVLEVFVKLEDAKSGYDIIRQLSQCTPDDIDKWNMIMTGWNANQAQHIFDLIHKRTKIISKLRAIVNEKTTDELHDIHPIIERELWIFGPEYEGGFLNFTSNISLNRIVDEKFGGDRTKLVNGRKRPDIVVFSQDHASPEGGPARGYKKVLVIELKRGGFHITSPEISQGQEYAKELKRAGVVTKDTPIDVYVIGSTLDDMAEIQEISQSFIRTIPITYDFVISHADQRMFYARKALEDLGHSEQADATIETAIQIEKQLNLVEQDFPEEEMA